VFAEAAAAAVLAPALRSLVFAEAAATAVLAQALLPLVFAEAAAAAVLAQALFCGWCSQRPLPPQSLHWLFRRWCLQRPLLTQSLHSLFLRWCGQRPLPTQSLHRFFRRLCSQWPLAAVPVPLAACGAVGPAGGVERLDPAAPPGGGAPSICLLPLAAIPVPLVACGASGAACSVHRLAGRDCLGGAKVTSPDNFSDFTRVCLGALIVNFPDKVSDFTTVPRSAGAWLWIPPVSGRGSGPALELAGRDCLGGAKVTSPDNFSDFTRVCLGACMDMAKVASSAQLSLYLSETCHGSKPLTRSKISEISQWQKCFSELKISNPRISCSLNGVRRSS